MATENYSLLIHSGDSKHDLLAQLYDVGRIEAKNRPVFRVNRDSDVSDDLDRRGLHLHINGIEAEDGSGNCWIIHGYVVAGLSWWFESKSFEGFYNTRTRQGWIRPRTG